MKMKYPTYVKLLINESDKQIAVQACDEHDDKSVQFYKENQMVFCRFDGMQKI